MRCELTFRWGRTRPTRARSSDMETLSRTRSLAGYTIDTRGSSFRKRQGLFVRIFPRTLKGQEVFHETRAKALARSASIRRRRYGGESASSRTAAAAAEAAAEAKHTLHHGRRHRLDAAGHLPSRADGRRDGQHRPPRERRRDLHGLRCHAELDLG